VFRWRLRDGKELSQRISLVLAFFFELRPRRTYFLACSTVALSRSWRVAMRCITSDRSVDFFPRSLLCIFCVQTWMVAITCQIGAFGLQSFTPIILHSMSKTAPFLASHPAQESMLLIGPAKESSSIQTPCIGCIAARAMKRAPQRVYMSSFPIRPSHDRNPPAEPPEPGECPLFPKNLVPRGA
jgi:hypothetical protein